jgi:hypothetical protein
MADVFWHMTTQTYNTYLEVFEELVATAQAGDQLGHEAAKDRLQQLPGYPYHMNPDLDRAVPVVDDTSTRIVTIGRSN